MAGWAAQAIRLLNMRHFDGFAGCAMYMHVYGLKGCFLNRLSSVCEDIFKSALDIIKDSVILSLMYKSLIFV